MAANKPYGGPEASHYPEHEANGVGRVPVRDFPYLGDNTQVFIGLMIGWISAPFLNQAWRAISKTIGIRRR